MVILRDDSLIPNNIYDVLSKMSVIPAIFFYPPIKKKIVENLLLWLLFLLLLRLCKYSSQLQQNIVVNVPILFLVFPLKFFNKVIILKHDFYKVQFIFNLLQITSLDLEDPKTSSTLNRKYILYFSKYAISILWFQYLVYK